MSDNTTIYNLLGGADGVRQLVDRFYDLMDSDPEVKELRDMHAKSLRVSREKLFLFLSGWLGGPNLYVEKYGHPRLRFRHLPFAIGAKERDQWMQCMTTTLNETEMPEHVREHLMQAFSKTADFMRNKAEHAPDNGLPVVNESQPHCHHG